MDSTKSNTQEANKNGIEDGMEKLTIVKNIKASITPGKFN